MLIRHYLLLVFDKGYDRKAKPLVMIFFNPKILMTPISASQPKPLKKKTQYQKTKITCKQCARLQYASGKFGFSFSAVL